MKSKESNPLYGGSSVFDSSLASVKALSFSRCQKPLHLPPHLRPGVTAPHAPQRRARTSIVRMFRRLGLRPSHSGTTPLTTPAHRFINIHAHPALYSNPYDLRTARPGLKPAIPATRKAEIPSHTHATCTSLSRPRSHSSSSVPDQPTQSVSRARPPASASPRCHSTQASLRPLCSPNPPAIGR